MDGNDYEDNDIDFHRFVIKMLELENEKIYWKILAQVRSSGEDYTGIRDWLFSEKDLDFKLFHEVLECFEIGENADITKVKLFADYIIRSAPSDIVSLKYLGAAQRVYDIFQRIATNGKTSMKQFARVSPTKEKIDIAKISFIEIARIFEADKTIFLKISTDGYIRLRGLSYQNLSISIKSDLLNQNDAKNLIEKYNSNQHPEDRIRYGYMGVICIVQNIKDTSSPDAPIYQILEKAGILDNAYPLNNQESSSKVQV